MKNSPAPAAFNGLVFTPPHELKVDKRYRSFQEAPVFRLPLEKKYNVQFKRAMDVVLSLLLLILLFSWMLPLIALMIRLDSKGPVFFLQKRNKKANQLFTCIKFRTMVPNIHADVKPAGLNDERITRMGRFLRKYYLDEMPQLLNVLWGDMSMIGPRPYMIADNIRYAAVLQHYQLRNTVKPGITGPAQLLGYRGAVSDYSQMAHRMHMDLLYIRNWSVFLDLEILFRTFLKAFLNRKSNCFRIYDHEPS